MQKPRVKSEHEPYRLADGRIRIGGGVFGIAAEISDADGVAWATLQAMDGTRSLDEIAAYVCEQHPWLSTQEAVAVTDQLIASGYVEDAAAAVPDALSPRERERYSRSQAFFRWVDLRQQAHGWQAQLRLRDASVLVLGLGGTGATAAWALAASGVGRLHCVDADVVELSNLNRQMLYTESDVGRAKVDVAVERLRRFNSDIAVTGERLRVTAPEDLTKLLVGCDVLALCADEPRGADGIRAWTNRACAAAGVPWVGAGYNGPLVTVGTFTPGGGACYECLVNSERERQRAQAERDEASMDFVLGLGGPGVMAASAGISGHLVGHAVIAVLTGAPELPTGCVYGVNLVAPDHLVMTGSPGRQPGCPVCG
ncbi:ThiF family adenylyltransferase [Plantactinospora sp. B6F1]|uniref:ThiF family adenylyltransferase n=1 Tax=Plantactinospora sp. B6F1 TaxID=3158971 RepID=UPI00102B1D05